MIIEFWKTGENPITCYHSVKNKEQPEQRIPKKLIKSRKQAVTVVSPDGKKEEYESVVQAADAVGVNKQMLYDFFNGRAKNTTQFEIYKSTLNN